MQENHVTEKSIAVFDQNSEKNLKHAKNIMSMFEYIEILFFCLLVILFIYGCNLRVCRVSGESMLPTLQDQQMLLVNGIGYEPKNGDIVVFHQINDLDPRYNEPIIKRVIATPGQLVRIDFNSCEVYVDNQLLQEDYILLSRNQYFVRAEHHMVNGIFEAVVPDGCIFVMGDNRNGSLDSRSSVIGFVDERRILCKVLVRLTPFELFGEVN
jgi:signal peptidase I